METAQKSFEQCDFGKSKALNGKEVIMLRLGDFKVNGAKSGEIQKLKSIIYNTLTILNSKAFKVWMLDYNFGRKHGKTNKEIYTMLLTGKDLFGIRDDDVDLHLHIYSNYKSKYRGFTFSNRIDIYLNRKYFVDEVIAGVICHEYFHNMGFTHSRYWTPWRKYTVPYAVGHIVERFYKRLNFGN